MRLVFVRHAETDYSVEKEIGEYPGPPLSDIGFNQAEVLANKILSKNPELIFCSDLKRALQTLEPAKHILNCPINIDSRLREVDDVLTGYSNFNKLKEPITNQKKRLDSFFKEIRQSNSKKIMVLCHFNVIEYLTNKLNKKVKKPAHAELYEVEL